MIQKLFILFLFFSQVCIAQSTEKIFTERQGKITFFSYTPVENIQASTNQAQSQFSAITNEIVVQIIMRTFQFKKSLMYEHFNESYIESDLYPKAFLQAKIEDFEPSQNDQTRIITGNFTLRGITKPVMFKANISKEGNRYRFTGELEVNIDDHKIKVPGVLSANIAKKIQVSFNFQFEPDEK